VWRYVEVENEWVGVLVRNSDGNDEFDYEWFEEVVEEVDEVGLEFVKML
jgi:hypothetical protein